MGIEREGPGGVADGARPDRARLRRGAGAGRPSRAAHPRARLCHPAARDRRPAGLDQGRGRDLDKVEAATGGAADPANMAADQRRGSARRRPVAPENLLCARASPRRCSPAGSISTSCPADDEEAIAALTAVKGIGRWTAEIYLLFAEGRPDIWPAGDLAVQIEIGRILGPRRQADREGDPRARRGLAPAPRRRGDLRLAPSARRDSGDLTRRSPRERAAQVPCPRSRRRANPLK